MRACSAAIACEPPADLEHGSISGAPSTFASPATVTFTCDEGYTNNQNPGQQPVPGTVFGPISSTRPCKCKDGAYDAPTCQAIPCGSITNLLPAAETFQQEKFHYDTAGDNYPYADSARVSAKRPLSLSHCTHTELTRAETLCPAQAAEVTCKKGFTMSGAKGTDSKKFKRTFYCGSDSQFHDTADSTSEASDKMTCTREYRPCPLAPSSYHTTTYGDACIHCSGGLWKRAEPTPCRDVCVYVQSTADRCQRGRGVAGWGAETY